MTLITISTVIAITAGILALFGACGAYRLCSKLDDFMLKLVLGGLLPIGAVLFLVGVLLSLGGN